MKIINVVGARPNFIKIAPLMRAYQEAPEISPLLVHTGQHYDEKMSDLFFRQLSIPAPDINLGVGGGTHAVQTAAIMIAFESVVLAHKPDAVLVVGDVNSTIGCGLVAAKLGVKLIHVEAGLRSLDRSMPEEINRVLVDSISDLFFITEESGRKNLLREGHDEGKIHMVGNLMIDSLLSHRAKAEASSVLEDIGVTPKHYGVVTLHRPANVDNPTAFARILRVLAQIQERLPLVFPIHPRSRSKLKQLDSEGTLPSMPNLKITEPLGYLEFMKLTGNARLVLTDSGGIQEETTILRVPCLTLRENTERPITCEAGTNRLVGSDPRRILKAFDDLMASPQSNGKVPPLWDGQAASRIVDVLRTQFKSPTPRKNGSKWVGQSGVNVQRPIPALQRATSNRL